MNSRHSKSCCGRRFGKPSLMDCAASRVRCMAYLLPLLSALFSTQSLQASDENTEPTPKELRDELVSHHLSSAREFFPVSFYESKLTPSQRSALIRTWAEQSADCVIETLRFYNEQRQPPTSLVISDDGTVQWGRFEKREQQESCLVQVWVSIGAGFD